MEINRDGRAGQTMLPGQSEHRLTEGRQGRWLYELEQALLLRSEKKPAAPEPQRQQAPEQQATLEPAVGVDQGAGDPTTGTTGMPAVDSGSSASQRPEVVPAQAAVAKSSVGDEVPTAAATPAPAPVAASSTGGGMAPAAASLAAAPQVMTTTPALSLAAAVAVGGAAQRTANEATSGGVQPTHESKAAVMGGLNWAARPVGDEAPAESAGPEEAEAPAPPPREQEPGDDYVSRLLHVYHGADGVQAWVRDAGIGAAQSLLLARGMADELGSAGNRLAALTVNGKKILSGSDSQPINSKGAV